MGKVVITLRLFSLVRDATIPRWVLQEELPIREMLDEWDWYKDLNEVSEVYLNGVTESGDFYAAEERGERLKVLSLDFRASEVGLKEYISGVNIWTEETRPHACKALTSMMGFNKTKRMMEVCDGKKWIPLC